MIFTSREKILGQCEVEYVKTDERLENSRRLGTLYMTQTCQYMHVEDDPNEKKMNL